MPYTFELLTIPQVHTEWHHIQPLFARAIKYGHGEMDIDDILNLVEGERMFISVLRKESKIVLAIAAEIKKYPRKKVLHVACAGGTDGRIMAHHFYNQLEQMGRVFNVEAVQCFCRPSIARLLRRYFPDIQLAYLVLQREVTP